MEPRPRQGTGDSCPSSAAGRCPAHQVVIENGQNQKRGCYPGSQDREKVAAPAHDRPRSERDRTRRRWIIPAPSLQHGEVTTVVAMMKHSKNLQHRAKETGDSSPCRRCTWQRGGALKARSPMRCPTVLQCTSTMEKRRARFEISRFVLFQLHQQ